MIHHKLILTALLLFALGGYAQGIEQLSFAATTEAIGLPFTNYSPYHPGIEMRVKLRSKEALKNEQSYHASFGAYVHPKLETGLYLGGEYQYAQMLFQQKMSLDFYGGLGYLHTFYPGELYKQTEEGDFETVSQWGRPHFYVNLGVGLTLMKNQRVQPFIRQDMLINTPFANGLPVILHSFLKIGLIINLNNHERK